MVSTARLWCLKTSMSGDSVSFSRCRYAGGSERVRRISQAVTTTKAESQKGYAPAPAEQVLVRQSGEGNEHGGCQQRAELGALQVQLVVKAR